MSIGLVIFLALVGIPLIEIAVFLEVGERIGLWPTLAMIFATAAIGTALIRHQGLSVLADARGSLERGEAPVRALLDGVCLLIAGAMLLTPGFVTDAFGAVLLIPPARFFLQAGVLRWIAAKGQFNNGGRAGRHTGGPVIIEGEFDQDDDDEPTPRAGGLPPQ